MLFTKVACAAALTAVVYANPDPSPANNAAAGGGTGTSLSANAIQSGSFFDGSNEIGSAEVGQAKSQTSQNNFINNCAGKTLTNGLQITTGSCNGITMGDIPAKTNMVSSVITFPTTGGASIQSDTTFNISVQMSNLVAGSFTNADATYYAAPQFLQGGNIVGHTHVTVQDMGGNLNPTQALDPTKFSFFKGINDAGNGQGLLQAVVTGGLPAGNYRVCTLASASNHQPVLMPVAQRGTADDCTKFTVSGSGTTINAAANNGAGGIAAAAAAASAVAAGPGAPLPASAASAASAVAAGSGTASSAATASTSAAAKGGKGGKGGKAVSAASSAAAAGTTSSAAAATTSAAAAAKGGKGGKGGKAVAASSSSAPAASAATAASSTSSTSSAAASSTAAAAGGAGSGRRPGGRFGGRKARRTREFIA